MFVDTAKVQIQAGKGGDGAVSFRHEIYVEKGGPDGGDGGRGGDVIFLATGDLNTLIDFRYKPELKAKHGVDGSKRDRHGAKGEDLIVKVPVGTLVRRDGKMIADMTTEGQRQVIASGGDGGFGNAHFKSSVRQTPRVAERGEVGEAFEIELELKLLADVGLVGFPNAGKSTFLSVVTSARPEIAAYAFTTLTPNLGVAKIDETSLLIADIPGLIEGASEGKGLGDAFLRHVERTDVLLHLIDAYTNDVAEAYKTIRGELHSYSQKLVDRPEVVALTKIEGLDKDIIKMQVDALKKVTKSPIFAISSSAHINLDSVLRILKEKVNESRAKAAEGSEEVESADKVATVSLSQTEISNSWKVEKVGDEFIVTGDKIEKFARRTNFDNFEGVNRLRDIMSKLGITRELYRVGAVGDSVIRIGNYQLTLLEQ